VAGVEPSLDDLRPEANFAGSEECVFAGVPAKEMRGLGVQAMIFARGPDFVEQERAGRLNRAMEVVGNAAFFASGGADQRADLGF
jgi:hypothetical protein